MSSVLLVTVELGAAALACGILYVLARVALRAIPNTCDDWRSVAAIKIRNLLIGFFAALVGVAIAANGYLLFRGVDPGDQTVGFIRSIPSTIWRAIATGLGKVTLALAGFLIATRLLWRLLQGVEKVVTRWHHLRDDERSVAVLFRGLHRAIVNLGWILLAAYASVVLPVPLRVTNLLLLVAGVYFVSAIGFILIRSTAVTVSTLDRLGHRYARRRDWEQQYNRLRSLLPTLRACVEYALWIAVASLVVIQMPSTQGLAAWGPRLIESIAIFFAGRALIELGHLEIEHRMLPREGLDESEHRRRATMVPLVRSLFTYGVYFGTAALMLGALGFNPMPFLAGAGLLGVVVGFGAQSLINDVVSGFFILFENIYLVGDMVEAGGARGVVESIEFRTTKIRDADGRVHIIRNGDMKPVINYSKDYTMAVVTMEVDYGADLQAVFAGLRHAGTRLRAESRDVIDDTRIDGITAFGASTMTVRTSTRVLPGRHETVAAAMRLLIKETMNRQVSGVSSRSPVVDTHAELDIERV